MIEAHKQGIIYKISPEGDYYRQQGGVQFHSKFGMQSSHRYHNPL